MQMNEIQILVMEKELEFLKELLRWKKLAAAKSTLLAHVNRELLEQMQIHEKLVSELTAIEENEISRLCKITFH
jgi:hypothetical protein